MSTSPPPPRLTTVLITGPTAGIGYSLAQRFARDRYRLVLVARDETRLRETSQQLGAVDTIVIAKDLSEPGAAQGLYRELEEQGITVDILVNNAGFGQFGLFAELDLDTMQRMIQLNVNALTELTRLVLPGMIARRSGKILNVASTAAYAPGPLMAVYYATKAFVLSFSDALANELEGTDVTVTCLNPGPTRSEFQKRAGMQFSRMVNSAIMDSDPVAEAGYQGLMRGDRTVIPGIKNQVMTVAARMVPRVLAARIVRTMQEDKRIK